MSRSRAVSFVALTVAAVSAIAGILAAPGSARGPGGCPANPKSSTPFKAWGDSTSYVPAQGGGVSLDDGQSMTTDCVRVPKPETVVRFFAQSTSGDGSLHVELLVDGTSLVLDGGSVSAPAAMGPASQVVMLPRGVRPGALPLQVRLTAVGGSFEIGDVYIDPYMQK